MRRDLPQTNLLLDGIRKEFHQRQTARYPTGAPVKLPCQFVEAVSETMLQFGQQPALFQRARALRCSHRLLEYKGFGPGHWPDCRRYRVAAQSLQSGNPFIAVDHQIAVDLLRDCHNNDWYLLTCGCQRSQQSALPLRAAYAQMLESQIQLVKLKVHTGRPRSVAQ